MSLELEAMPNNLVNYGVTENGIAIIELSSDSDGKPLTDGKIPVNTYTREMWEDIDTAIKYTQLGETKCKQNRTETTNGTRSEHRLGVRFTDSRPHRLRTEANVADTDGGGSCKVRRTRKTQQELEESRKNTHG